MLCRAVAYLADAVMGGGGGRALWRGLWGADARAGGAAQRVPGARLAHAGGDGRARDPEAASGLSRISRMVDTLEQRGLVERPPCPTDGRAINAHLTDAGLTLARPPAGSRLLVLQAP